MKRHMIVCSLVFALTVSIFSGADAAQTIKFATLAPEGSTWMSVMRQFNDDVKKATAGEVEFKLYAGGVAGDEKDVVRKMRFNQYHSGGFTGVGLGEILPDVRILDTAGLMKSYEEVDFILDRFAADFAGLFESKGYVLLGWAPVGFVYIYSQNPIATMDDLKSVKMWAWEGDPISAVTFKEMGISPVTLPITDVLTSLQTNLINTVYTGPLACVSLQWFTRVKYMSSLKLTHAIGAVLVSKKEFDRISSPHQTIIRRLADKHFRELVDRAREDDRKSLEIMQKNGMKMVEFDETQRPRFDNACEVARTQLAGSLYSVELMTRITIALKEFRASSLKK